MTTDTSTHFRTIINFETGESDLVPENDDERHSRLTRQRAAAKAAAFSNRKAMEEARTEALTLAWQRAYAGQPMPIHYDLILTSGEFTKLERFTLVDAALIENVFDPTQLVGCKGAFKIKRGRRKNVDSHFVLAVGIG